MKQNGSFIEGPILSPLLRFTFPVLLALLLQAMYGAVDLMVVGQFGQPADVSAVSTGSQVMHTVTALVTGLSMGATVLLGQKLGEGRKGPWKRYFPVCRRGPGPDGGDAVGRVSAGPADAGPRRGVCADGGLCADLLRRRGLLFSFSPRDIRFERQYTGRILRLGIPVALQDVLVSVSFLAIAAIVNGLGVIASAGVGVAEKLCGFIMLVPSSFGQSLSAFVAQNIGAGRRDRAKRAMLYGMGSSLCCGVLLAWLSFFHGGLLAGLFARDAAVIGAAADYLRAYAIDTLLTSILFCFIGYFNGRGSTAFVMAQGIIGAFLVRIPVSLLMSRMEPVSLFRVGLATPCSTVVQILLFLGFYAVTALRDRRAATAESA